MTKRIKKEMPMSELLERLSYTVEESKKIITISSLFSIPMTMALIKIVRSYLKNDK